MRGWIAYAKLVRVTPRDGKAYSLGAVGALA
jgi:hypothetical protein